jgi:hypothetical protein
LGQFPGKNTSDNTCAINQYFHIIYSVLCS